MSRWGRGRHGQHVHGGEQVCIGVGIAREERFGVGEKRKVVEGSLSSDHHVGLLYPGPDPAELPARGTARRLTPRWRPYFMGYTRRP
jgi:hypothetical protein